MTLPLSPERAAINIEWQNIDKTFSRKTRCDAYNIMSISGLRKTQMLGVFVTLIHAVCEYAQLLRPFVIYFHHIFDSAHVY